MPQARSAQTNDALVRALAVVVIYRKPFAQSKTLAGLARAFAEDPSLAQQLDVLVWENSPEAQEQRELPFAFTYQHSPANEGVSGAYNAAARMAAERGCGWLQLLDDDTSVTGEFLHGMLRHADQAAAAHRMAAGGPLFV